MSKNQWLLSMERYLCVLFYLFYDSTFHTAAIARINAFDLDEVLV